MEITEHKIKKIKVSKIITSILGKRKFYSRRIKIIKDFDEYFELVLISDDLNGLEIKFSDGI